MRNAAVVFVTTALLHSLACAGPRGYRDASAGLETPQMEGGATEFEFGDVNGDGYVDLVSVGDHGSPLVDTDQHGVMVWFGDGAGSWSVFQAGGFGYGGVALGDANDDGLMDVGYGVHHDWGKGDFGDQLLEVALGDGSGRGWTPWDDGLGASGESWGMFGTDFADVDNDGDLDVGSTAFGCCAGVHIYLNNGDGSWTRSWGRLGGNSALIFQFGDFDGDGNADFAVAHGDGTVYLGDGAGSFTDSDGNLGSAPRRGLSVGDVNGDGRDDVAWTNSAGVEVWTLDGDAKWVSVAGALAAIGRFDFTQIADMNVDGHGDVIVFRSGLMRVYAGDGAGGWTLAASAVLPDGCGARAFRAGTDTDHNGYPDAVLVQEEDCRPIVGGANRPRVLVETSAPETPFAVVAAPAAGETWIAGSVRFVDWHSGIKDSRNPGTVTVAVSTNGPRGPWRELATTLPNNGRYQWRVPWDHRVCTACRIRVTLDGIGIGAISAPFSIVGGR